MFLLSTSRLGRSVLFLAVLGLALIAPCGFVSSVAQAQSDKGELWVGWLETKSQNLRLVVELSSTKVSSPNGTIRSLDQATDPLPITNATIDPKQNISFEVVPEGTNSVAYSFQGTFEDERLVGQIQQAGVKLPIEFTKASSLPAESTERLGANSAWLGSLDVGTRKVPLRLRIYNSAPFATQDKPRVLLDSLLENANGFPVSVNRNENGSFEFSIPAIPGNAKYIAELSPDQRTLAGKFQQGFLPLQLNMVRVGELETNDPAKDAMVQYLSNIGKTNDEPSETDTPKPAERKSEEETKSPAVAMPQKSPGLSPATLPNGLQEQTFTVERLDSRKPLLNDQGKRADNSFVLEGTITLPKGFNAQSQYPAVVLVTGSGPQDRDETIGKHKPFKDIAHYLASQGMVVVRYDDRGAANSTGDFVNATTLDFADDALAVWEFVRGLEGVDRSRVGLLGHSEGGVVGPMVAAWQREVAFLILVAPPVLPGAEILSSQIDRIAELEGVGADDRAAAKGLQEDLQRIALRFPADDEAALSEVRKAVVQRWDSLSRLSQAIGGSDEDARKKLVIDAITAQFRGLQTPWMRHFLAYDPSSNWVLFDCPVLAIWAEKDTQVLFEPNRKKLVDIVTHNMNMKADLVVLPGLNHLLQKANTGLPDEYDQIDSAIDPLALETFGNWLKERKILP